MLKVRSRSGLVGVTAGAAALLALPMVAVGQVPVVDQVVGGVTQTAQSLASQPPAPAPPAGAPAVPAPATHAAPAPASSAPAGAPRQVTATGAPGSGSAGDGSTRGASGPRNTGARGGSGPGSSGVRKRDAGGRSRSAGKRNASGVRAGAAQSDAGAAQSDGTDGGGSQAGTAVATDVEIAAGESGDEAGPAALPFTGFQLLLLAMLGLGAIAGGAALRRAA